MPPSQRVQKSLWQQQFRHLKNKLPQRSHDHYVSNNTGMSSAIITPFSGCTGVIPSSVLCQTELSKLSAAKLYQVWKENIPQLNSICYLLFSDLSQLLRGCQPIQLSCLQSSYPDSQKTKNNKRIINECQSFSYLFLPGLQLAQMCHLHSQLRSSRCSPPTKQSSALITPTTSHTGSLREIRRLYLMTLVLR